MFPAILLLAVSLVPFASCAPPETLRMVNLLYRHGDRSPFMVYPKDINPASTWPDGFSWLTNLGKQEQFELGKFIRQRYGGFLNVTRYHFDQIRVESSAAERCLMSASSNLAGLFPPQGDQVWRKDFPWQPIAIQTRPLIEDSKLALTGPCPRYIQLMLEVSNSQYIKDEDKKNKEFYEWVSNATGFHWTSMNNIWYLSDLLLIEKIHNLTWNDFAYQPGVWEKLHQIHIDKYAMNFQPPELAKLMGGPLLSEIISNMKAAAETKKAAAETKKAAAETKKAAAETKEAAAETKKAAAETKKPKSPIFHMYSGHDNTVAALLRVMNVYNWLLPLFSSTVFVELHEIDGDYKVKIFYRNDTTVEPYELVPEGCGKECSLDSFIEVTKEYVPVDFKLECEAQPRSSSPTISKATFIGIGVGAGIFILVIIIVLAVAACQHRKMIAYSRLR